MPNDEAFRFAARRLYPNLDIEDDAHVSTAPDGAFVAAWIWVPITEGQCADSQRDKRG